MSEVINIKELNERIERESVFVDTLRTEMGKVIVGQGHLVDTLLIGLLSNLLRGISTPMEQMKTFLSPEQQSRMDTVQFMVQAMQQNS